MEHFGSAVHCYSQDAQLPHRWLSEQSDWCDRCCSGTAVRKLAVLNTVCKTYSTYPVLQPATSTTITNTAFTGAGIPCTGADVRHYWQRYGQLTGNLGTYELGSCDGL
jgi:hypothetical protein